MPSPNVPKRTPDKKTHLAPGLAKRKSQDFGAKIQGWNDGGGEARNAQKYERNELVSPIDKENEPEIRDDSGDSAIYRGYDALEEKGQKVSSPPKTPGLSSKNSRKVDLERQAWVRKRSKPQVEITEDVRQATTPKKRLVSDGNWRRDRGTESPLSPEFETTKETTPKPSTAKRSVASFGLKVPPSTYDYVEVVPDSRSRRNDDLKQPRSRSPLRPHRRSREDTTPDFDDGELKVYIKSRRRSRTVAEGKSQKESTASGSSFTGLSATTALTTPLKESPPRPSTAPREKGTRGYFAQDDVIRRSSRRASKSDAEADKSPVDVRPATAEPRGTKGDRIQGWLSTTRDPFLEYQESALTPQPLKIAKRSHETSLERRPSSTEEEERGRRKISGNVLSKGPDNIAKRKISGSRLRARANLEPIDIRLSNRRSVSPAEESVVSSAPSTPTLQRSGARRAQRSPVKSPRVRTPELSVEKRSLSREASYTSAGGRTSGSGWDSRIVPSTGRNLSTVISETSSDYRSSVACSAFSGTGLQSIVPGESALSLAGPVEEPKQQSTGLKRRLTKHSDLMSVLSLPRGDQGSIVSARSLRRRRPRSNSATLVEMMNTITTDELRYQRELRTLVDGVIPVLLTYVLQRTDPSGAKRLFSSTSKDGHLLTRPIVDMGITLERLKASHKRVPLTDSDELLRWAEGASKVYTAYIKTWRLGFEDIVVNLAPADEKDTQTATKWDAGLPRNQQGDLVGGDGERVDVAYLLKRPLVRLKHLSKALKIISEIRPSAKSEDLATEYQELVATARKRASDERARIEDEAAAGIDPTRARDPRSMEPLNGVRVDSTRSVRARDYFDLELLHSSGQQLGCKIEIIIRDDAPDKGSATDILFCEISLAGRWLLFPPIAANYVSARKGEEPGQLVIMIRGMTAAGREGREWREVMSLYSGDEGAAEDWLEMLGSSPIPSMLSKKSSFNGVRALPPPSPTKSRRPETVPEVEVPIGEQASSASRLWDGSDVNSVADESSYTETVTTAKPSKYRGSAPSTLSAWTEESYEDVHARLNSGRDRSSTLQSRSRYRDRPPSSQSLGSSDWTSVTGASVSRKDQNACMPSGDYSEYSGFSEYSAITEREQSTLERPGLSTKKSSVPSAELPTIPRVRQASPPTTPRQSHDLALYKPAQPTSAPAKLQEPLFPEPTADVRKDRDGPRSPTPSSRGTASSLASRSNALQIFSPKAPPSRRSSSPLKHEYAPSSASESLGDSDLSDLEDDDDLESITSESSGHEEAISTVGELRNFKSTGSLRPVSRGKSMITPSGSSLSPSESASQAPYRNITQSLPLAESVACLFDWADAGSWESLHPDECCIIVTPGLIEAFDMAQAHGLEALSAEQERLSPSARGVKPLVALELTPLVPLRRGTALDISIRSPPTANSFIRTGNNIMFRSRTSEECEKLYTLINRARIDNPTFIAMQNARGPQSNWGEIMDRRNNERPDSSAGSSWWKMGSRKGSTYRSSGTRLSKAGSESSGRTTNSVSSALRRLSGGGSIFNIAKSTLQSRENGTRSSYSDSLSSGAATPVPIDTRLGTPMGITNTKIRLYFRETASKWRDLGPARLTVMNPPRNDPAIISNPKATGNEKRIIINGKNEGDVLLDVVLGESCFERVARTGIAVSVWEESIGPNGEVGHIAAVGGVGSAKSRVYMIQMSSERDATYTFSLVGKLRY